MGLMDVVNMAKSKVRYSRIKRRGTRMYTERIGPEGIVGSKNYDTHSRTIRSYIDKGDYDGAQSYVKQQKAAMRMPRIKTE